ncbi:MAG TPA: hypothetical protein VM577_00465 [Anaerovoracaceae bacterium]|nr:hypothetical protein [Anaerovoracaceae bacterium]
MDQTEYDYCFWEEYLVHADFETYDFEGAAVLENAIRGKARYIPPKEELLRYADSEYYEITPQVEKLEEYVLANLTQDRMEALGLVREIALACMAEQPMEEIMDIFNDYGIEI